MKPALIYDPLDPRLLLTPEEAKAAKHTRQRSADPEFAAKRVRWLQKKHKQPLADRCRHVVGKYAEVALPKLAALPDQIARHILRAAVRAIPDQDAHRRWKYICACIERESPKRNVSAEEAELILANMDDDDWRNLDQKERQQLKAIYAALPDDDPEYSISRMRKRVGDKSAMRLVKLCQARNDPEMFRRLCRNVCRAKHPIRYVGAVIENLKAAMK